MTQAKILYWREGKPQIGQDTGGRDTGSYIPGEKAKQWREGESPLWTL